MSAAVPMATLQASMRREAAILTRAPAALVLMRGGRVHVPRRTPTSERARATSRGDARRADLRARAGRDKTGPGLDDRMFPRDVEVALRAISDRLHTDVFLPLHRAITVRDAGAVLRDVQPTFRALWEAFLATIAAGLQLEDRAATGTRRQSRSVGSSITATAVAEAVLRDVPSLPRDLWTGRLASARLGAASLPFWAAAFDARVQAGLALARGSGALVRAASEAQASDVIESALQADLAIMCALDVLAPRRPSGLAPAVSRWLAERANDHVRRVFALLATPLYREAETRGA